MDPRDQLENRALRERGGLGEHWGLLENKEPLVHKGAGDKVDSLAVMGL